MSMKREQMGTVHRLFLIGHLLILALGCATRFEDNAQEDTKLRQANLDLTDPSVVFVGCHQLDGDGVCQLEPKPEGRELSFWIGLTSDEGSFTLAIDDERVEPESRYSDLEGQSFQIQVPLNARKLSIKTMKSDGTLGQWSLSFRDSIQCDDVDAARSLRNQGKSEEALAFLRRREVGSDHACQVPYLGLMARLFYDLGDNTSTMKLYEQAIATAHGKGNRLSLLNDTLAYSFALFMDGQYGRARNLLESLEEPFGDLGEARARLPYYRGRAQWQIGDLRHAEKDFDHALTWARRLGMVVLLVNTVEMQSLVSVALGREQEAIPILRKLAKEYGPKLSDCQHAMVLASIGWAEFIANDRMIAKGSRPGFDPLPIFKHSRQLLNSGCGNRSHETNVVISMALAAIQNGDLSLARAHIEEAKNRSTQMPEQFRVWLVEAESRLAFRQGQPKLALQEYRRLESQLTPLAEGELLVKRGQALALLEMDLAKRAIASFYRAEQLLEESIPTIPIQGGRATFAAAYMDLSARFVEFLATRGKIAEAMQIARRSRARAIQSVSYIDKIGALSQSVRQQYEKEIELYRRNRDSLEDLQRQYLDAARDEQRVLKKKIRLQKKQVRHSLDNVYSLLDGRAPRSERMRPVQSGEVLILYSPIQQGWIGFAASEKEINWTKIDRDADETGQDPELLSSRFLGPFQAQIQEAETVTFLVSGELEKIDFHGLPLGDKPLGVQKKIAYGLDVPRAVPPEEGNGKKRALIIADPSGDLMSAEREVQMLQARLSPSHQITLLRQEASARERVEAELTKSDLVHFAGHALFEGSEGWSSSLVLAGGEKMDIGDILAMDRVPSQVVLVACESGRSDDKVPVQTMGVGQAFVVAGSAEVVITSRPLDNETAVAMTELLYQQGSHNLVEALHRSSLELYSNQDRSDWMSFRAVIP